jgi:hypothetical protein
MSYQKTNPNSKSQDEALHITNLSYKGQNIKIVVEFGISNSSMPRGGSKFKPPDSLIEIYGQPKDLSLNPNLIKEKIDKKA